MTFAKLTTATGYTWTTSVNGTDAEICRYFLGQTFDCGTYDKEDMQQVIECQIVDRIYKLAS